MTEQPPAHPFTGDDLADRVLGELQATAQRLVEAMPRILAASTIALLMSDKEARAERQLYINGKNNRQVLLDLEEAGRMLTQLAFRVNLTLATEDHEKANAAIPEFEDLVRGASPVIRSDDAPPA